MMRVPLRCGRSLFDGSSFTSSFGRPVLAVGVWSLGPDACNFHVSAREIRNADVASTSSFRNHHHHIKTTFPQQFLLTVGSALVGLANPERTDMIATLSETTGLSTLKRIYRKMASDPVGQQILREKPLINSKTVDIDYLSTFPEDTFGKQYANFMQEYGLTSDTRSPVCFVEDDELAYIMFRYRSIHDFTHVLLGMPSISVAAEVAVKWFEMAQTGLPMTFLSSTFGLYARGITSRERRILVTKLVPWALLCGYNSKFILNVYYEKEFERKLADLRAELGIVPSPVTL